MIVAFADDFTGLDYDTRMAVMEKRLLSLDETETCRCPGEKT